MARIIPIAIVGLALVLYALWRGAYPDLFEEGGQPPAQTAAVPAGEAPAATGATKAPAPGPEAAPDKLPVTPQLDVVRIDKDGDTVIAGKAEPGASVTIATQDRTLAVVEADDRGKWVALPEKPLPAGEHAVTIRATGKDGKTEVGDKTIVVSIPEENTGEKPLVVAVPTKDFGASEVLQRPGPPPGAEEPAGIGRETPLDAPAPSDKPIVMAEAPAQPAGTVAEAPKPQRAETTDEGATQSGGADEPVAAAEASATPAAQPAQPDRAAAREGEAGEPPSTVASTPASGKQATPAAATGGKTVPEDRPGGETPATVAEAPAKPMADKAASGQSEPDEPAATVAEAPVKPMADKTAPVDGKSGEASATVAKKVAKPGVNTVAPVAGKSGEAPATVAERVAKPGVNTVAPMAGKSGEETQPAGPAAPAVGEAEKPPAAVAEAPDALAPSGTAAPAAPAPAATAGQQAATERQPSSAGVSVDSVDYDDRGNLALAGKAEPGSVVEPKIASQDSGTESLGEARADEKGAWRLKVERPVAPGRYDLTVEERTPEGATRSRIRLPFERADPIADFPAGAVVVVQPGNSLWRIARKIYGRGVRYTVIYAANRTQIGNPDLIFPGQIFSVPEKTQVN